MKKLLLTLLAALLLFSGCAAQKQESQPQQTAAEQTAELEPSAAPQWEELRFDTSLPLSYATQFSVRYAEGGYTDITIGSDQEFLLVAQDAAVPENVPSSITILRQPLSHIYLVASAAMDYFDRLDAVDRIALSGLKASDWYIESAKAAMENGSMVYAGKYSAPDYETILEAGCDLAIENTMIYHTPEVIEQLQTVGVPVLVERSSYESDPLGRIEWLKLYAALVGKRRKLLRILNRALPPSPAFSTIRLPGKPSRFSTSTTPARSTSASRATTLQRQSASRAENTFPSTKAGKKTRFRP